MKNDEQKNEQKMRMNVLIYPRFQLKLLALNIGITVAMLSFVAIQVTRSMNHLKELGVQAGFDINHIYFKFIDVQATTIYTNIGIAIGLGILVSTLLTLRISHKLAGPIVRLTGYFKEISETKKIDYDLKFRKGDFFSELPETINVALKNLK